MHAKLTLICIYYITNAIFVVQTTSCRTVFEKTCATSQKT